MNVFLNDIHITMICDPVDLWVSVNDSAVEEDAIWLKLGAFTKPACFARYASSEVSDYLHTSTRKRPDSQGPSDRDLLFDPDQLSTHGHLLLRK